MAPNPSGEGRANSLSAGLADRLVKGSAHGLRGTLTSKGLAVGLQILLGRFLGPNLYGILALGNSLRTLGQSVASLGLKTGVTRYISIHYAVDDDHRVRVTYTVALVMAFLSSLGVSGLLFLMADALALRVFAQPELSGVLKIFAVALPFYVLLAVAGSLLRSVDRISDQQTVVNGIHPALTFLSVAALLVAGFSLNGAAVGFAISVFASACFGLYYTRGLIPASWSLGQFASEAPELIRFSVPMMLAGLAYLMTLNVDRLLLGYFAAASDVGLYQAASLISLNFGSLIFTPVVTIASPLMAQAFGRERVAEVGQIYALCSRWIFVAAAPIYLTVIILPSEILGLFGPEFQAAIPLLIILASAQLVFLTVGPSGELLQMTGHQKLDLGNTSALLVVNIALDIILIPKYGALGAAVGTGAAVVLVNLAQLIEIRYLFGFSPFSMLGWMVPTLMVGVGVIGFFLRSLVPPTAIAWIPFGVAIIVLYIVAFILLGSLPIEQRILRNGYTQLRSRISGKSTPGPNKEGP